MEIGNERIYNTAFKDIENVVLWDIFPVTDGELISITLESKNSEYEQGIWIMCDKGIEISGEKSKSLIIWYERPNNFVKIRCFSENGNLSIYNVWDRGLGPDSQGHSSGMLIEEIPNGRRYRCNDSGFETNFDKLIFRLERFDLLE